VVERSLFEGANARWSRATVLAGQGRIRERLDNTKVFEQLALVPTGGGEHVFLEIGKWGRRSLPTTGAIRDLEIAAIANKDSVRDTLEKVGVKQDRRALTLRPSNLSYWLNLGVLLPKDTYATTVLGRALDLEAMASGR